MLGVDANLEALSMLEFQQHELWLSGNNGLFRLPADGLRRAQCDRQAPVDYARFGRADGLSAPAQSSLGVPNMTVTPDGRLWAAANGVRSSRSESADLAAHKFPSSDLCGRSHHWTSESAAAELMLAPGTNHIEIQFDSIELASPEKIRFQYKLDGVDADWLNADKTRKAVYTSVPPVTTGFISGPATARLWDRAGMTYNVFQRPYYYETKCSESPAWLCGSALKWRLLAVRQITSQVKSRSRNVSMSGRESRDICTIPSCKVCRASSSVFRR